MENPGEVIYWLVMGVLFEIWVIELLCSHRRPVDLPPKITSEGTDIKRGLTAVEAAVLLERPMDTVLTMILFGVLKKGAARIVSPKPLELQVTEPLPEGLYEYEVDILKTFQDDKQFWAVYLKWDLLRLVRSVSKKMRGYSPAKTVKYYRGVVEEAWQEVKAAATPEVKSQKFDEKMDWAMLDSNFVGRIAEALGAGPLPVPGWWERFAPLMIQPAAPASSQVDFPTVSAGPDMPAGALPELPGADFAASIANGIQNFSAAAIGDVQDFASEIADQTSLWITEAGGGHDSGWDGGHDGGHDSWWDSGHHGGHDSWWDSGHDAGHDSGSDGGFDGGYDGGGFDGGDFDGGDIDFD